MSLNNHSFIGSFNIQKRVISALFLREIITRYGRHNIGFLWLFLEPMMVTICILLLWKIARADTIYNLPVIAFMLTGYPLAMMWRNSANRCIGAISANAGLLYHHNVRSLDIFISRIFLEIFGCSIAFLLMFICLFLLEFITTPANFLQMILAWFLMTWFSFGLGFVIGIISEKSRVFANIWRPTSFLLFPISGIFFLVDALPQKAQQFLLYIPMIHGTELLRHGYFGTNIKTHEDISYLILVNLILLFFGLALVRQYSNKMEPL